MITFPYYRKPHAEVLVQDSRPRRERAAVDYCEFKAHCLIVHGM